MKPIGLINIILAVAVIILAVNLVKPIGTITGNVIYGLDTAEQTCYFKQFGELNKIPIDLCCLELQKQLACESIAQDGFNFRCYTSRTSERYYLTNYKAFNYCIKEGYDVKMG